MPTELSKRFQRLLRPKNLLVVGIPTLLYLTFLFAQISVLNRKSYQIRKSDLFRLDSVKMLEKGYIGGSRNAGRGISFKDETYHNFRLYANANAVKDYWQLYDSLQNCDLVMTVFTNKQGFEVFSQKENTERIEVLDILIGNKSYVPIESANAEQQRKIHSFVLVTSIAYMIFLLVHLVRVFRLNNVKL